MLTVLAFCSKDSNQAERLARWLIDLGGCKGHELLLGVDSSVAMAQSASILELFTTSFDKVTVLPISNPYDKWPAAPNFCYSTLARHIEENKLAPYWFWCEPDCVFLKNGAIALDVIESEHKSAGKPFTGDLVVVEGVPDHMSGIAVYPGQMTRHAGLALISFDLAWDVAASDQILPRLNNTKLIAHSWNHKPFENWEHVEREVLVPHPEAVIFHASKDGSLINLLRARMNLPASVLTEFTATSKAVIPSVVENEARESTEKPELKPVARGGQFICDLFLKTFPGDYLWAEYCLRSIDKFCTGFRRVVILAPDEGCPRPKVLPHVLTVVSEKQPGYNWQQVVKLNADQYTDASHILFMDSDCVFTKPVTPQTFMRDNKILWLMTPFEHAREDQKRAWIPVMTKWIGKEPEFEWMRRHPFMFPRWLCEKMHNFCVFKHGRTLEQYALEQGEGLTFSEFNCAGFLAYEQFRDQFEWINTETDTVPEETVRQEWSRGGLTEEIKAKFEQILGGGDAKCDLQKAKADSGTTTNADATGHCHGEAKSDPETSPIKQTAAGIWVLTNDSHISKWVEEKGQLQHDFQTLPVVLPEIPVGGTVIDVGAFIGDTSIPFVDRVGETGMVYAFEPNPDAFECLQRNISAGIYPNVIAENAALSDQSGYCLVHVNENAGATYVEHCTSDGGRFNLVTLDGWMSARSVTKCDFIKIDVEGFELRVLKGAEETINKFRPKMLIEINERALNRQGSTQSEVLTWLTEHGYQFWPVNQPNLEQAGPQYDILCKPVKKENHMKYIVEGPEWEEVLVPWANKEESIAEIDLLALRLKQFCTAPRTTLVVRERLRKIRVITKVR